MQVATDTARTAVTNPVFQNWTVAIGLLAAVSFLVWILVKDSPDIGEARLEIRELVSSVFQQVVIEEAQAIFHQVDDQLPYTLSQVNVVSPDRTSFDFLLEGLRDLAGDEEDDPSREAYHVILKNALGGIVVHQVERLLDEALRVARAPVGEKETRSGLRISFAAQTQRKLVLLASIYNKTDKKERTFYVARKWATYLTTAAVVLGLFAAIPIFLNSTTAYTAFIVLISAFLLLVIASVIATSLAKGAQNWLTEHARRYETGTDMMRDFAERRGMAI